MQYDLADAGRLTEAGREFVAAVLAERRVEDVDVAALVPSLLTAYNRSTLLLGDDEQTSRATIDDGLSLAPTRRFPLGLRPRQPDPRDEDRLPCGSA